MYFIAKTCEMKHFVLQQMEENQEILNFTKETESIRIVTCNTLLCQRVEDHTLGGIG